MKKCYISENIKAYRAANKISQKELAEKLGVTFQAISKWENEICFPDIFMLLQIAELSGVSIDALMMSSIVIVRNRIGCKKSVFDQNSWRLILL